MYRDYFKRALDLLFSIIIILVFSPIYILIGIVIALKLGRPVFFKQARPGLHEKKFNMYKFRSMSSEKDKSGQLLPDDQRLDSFGRILRSSSLDELPEIFNIIKGDMSFIGPRPLLTSYLPHYNERERIRHTVRPGLTGLAQVNGRNLSSWDERLENDVKYVNNITFINDVKIIIATIKTVIFRENITVGSQHVMQNLDEERKEANFLPKK